MLVKGELDRAREEVRQRVPMKEKRKQVQAALTKCEAALQKCHEEYAAAERILCFWQPKIWNWKTGFVQSRFTKEKIAL